MAFGKSGGDFSYNIEAVSAAFPVQLLFLVIGAILCAECDKKSNCYGHFGYLWGKENRLTRFCFLVIKDLG